MKSLFNFKLDDYNAEYYRIYQKALEADLNKQKKMNLIW